MITTISSTEDLLGALLVLRDDVDCFGGIQNNILTTIRSVVDELRILVEDYQPKI
jgi:hypothetical protein